MATTEKAVVRGSAEMSEDMFGKPNEISRESIRKLIKVTRMSGAKLESWWIRGQPAIDVIFGSLQVKPDRAGDIIKELLTIRDLPLKCEGFPLGTINPELIQINFSTPGAGH